MKLRSGSVNQRTATGDANGTSKTNGHHMNGRIETSSHNHSKDGLMGLVHRTLVPIFLMINSPNLVIMLWYTAVKCDGSFSLLGQELTKNGLLNGIIGMWSSLTYGSTLTTSVLFGYCVFQLILMKTMPGPVAYGPVTPKGNVPKYKDNGFACFIATMISFVVLTYFLKQNGMTPTIVYDRFDEFLATLTVFSMGLCLILYLKGLYMPSTTDSGSSGNFIFDYYWGTELYPRICGFDVKVFTNCRFGMTVWPLLVAIFTLKNYEVYGFVDSAWVSCALHMVYFTKFFWWEAGYMRTIDIMLDRAGFYICWGCLVYIAGLYASPSMYFANHPVYLGNFLSVAFLVCGTFSTFINYWADLQKQEVRRTDGKCLIWGKKPEIIRATYTLESGEKHNSILLVSGWWGVARHFHYVPELMLAFFWSVPAMFDHVMPYTYFLWLVVLLTHRIFRDEEKCSMKYHKYWKQYCDRVPYRMIPGIF